MNVANVKQKILSILKEQGEATTAELAALLDNSYEAVRQQLKQLEEAELVLPCERANPSGVGRPIRYYTLSRHGDHHFPKAYDALAVTLLDTVYETWGPEGLRQALATLSQAQVARWESVLASMDLEDRLHALRDFYLQEDPFTEVRREGDDLQLLEHNCPFLNVALQRPALCSVTVSTLERLLQHPVSRERRFQDGDGCCVFHVHHEISLDENAPAFRFEDEESDTRSID